jgi:hypothetical protein
MVEKVVDCLVPSLLFSDPVFNPTCLYSKQRITTTKQKLGGLYKW